MNLSADLANFSSAAPELVVWGPRLLSNRLPGLFPGVTILVVLLVAIVTWKRPAGLVQAVCRAGGARDGCARVPRCRRL